MNRCSPHLATLAVAAMAGLSTLAYAGDALGIYIGDAVGRAGVHLEQIAAGNPFSGSDKQPLGRKLDAGLRPLRVVGAFAVGFIPLPVPLLDPFVKAGLARMRSSVSDSYGGAFHLQGALHGR